MNPADFIEQTRTLLKSGDSVGAVAAISKLPLPEDACPLIILINGDCEEYNSMDRYVTEYDDPTEEELKDFRQRLSEKVIGKLRQYLQDWDDGDMYRYSFSLSYGLTGLEAGFQDAYHVEHISVTKNYIGAKTIPEALAAAKEWEAQLLGNIVLYKDQERGHKGGGVSPHYVIKNRAGITIASGSLGQRINSEFGSFGLGV